MIGARARARARGWPSVVMAVCEGVKGDALGPRLAVPACYLLTEVTSAAFLPL